VHFESLQEFLAMGGYAFYVWISFAVTFISMLILALHSKWDSRKLMQDVLTEQKRIQRMKVARQKHSSRKVDDNLSFDS
jgi:heme exporter protein D